LWRKTKNILVDDKLKDYAYKAKFATLSLKGVFITQSEVQHGGPNVIFLRDVKYNIFDGIFYVEGTELHFERIDKIGKSVTPNAIFREVLTFAQKQLDALETPIELMRKIKEIFLDINVYILKIHLPNWMTIWISINLKKFLMTSQL
jgi:hypothetical protein